MRSFTAETVDRQLRHLRRAYSASLMTLPAAASAAAKGTVPSARQRDQPAPVGPLQAKDIVVTFLRYCYPAFKKGSVESCPFFPNTSELLIGKEPTFRLYAGALIKRSVNAVLATHNGLISSLCGLSQHHMHNNARSTIAWHKQVGIGSAVGPASSSQGIFRKHARQVQEATKSFLHFLQCTVQRSIVFCTL